MSRAGQTQVQPLSPHPGPGPGPCFTQRQLMASIWGYSSYYVNVSLNNTQPVLHSHHGITLYVLSYNLTSSPRLVLGLCPRPDPDSWFIRLLFPLCHTPPTHERTRIYLPTPAGTPRGQSLASPYCKQPHSVYPLAHACAGSQVSKGRSERSGGYQCN